MVLLKWNKWIQFYLFFWASLGQDGRVPCLESTVHCAEEDFYYTLVSCWSTVFAWPVNHFQHLSRTDWWVSIFSFPTTPIVIRLFLCMCARASLYPCLWWEECMCDMSAYAPVCWYMWTRMCIHMYIHVFCQNLGSLTQEHLPCVFGSSWVWTHQLDQMGQLASPRDDRQVFSASQDENYRQALPHLDVRRYWGLNSGPCATRQTLYQMIYLPSS